MHTKIQKHTQSCGEPQRDRKEKKNTHNKVEKMQFYEYMRCCIFFFYLRHKGRHAHDTFTTATNITKAEQRKKIHCLKKTEAEMSLFFGLFSISTAFSLFTTVHFVWKFEYTSAPLGMHTSNC